MSERSERETADRIRRVGLGHEDGRALRAALLAEIRRNVGFDAYAWVLTDPETEVGSDPLADVPCLDELPKLIRLKYLTATNRWTGLTTPVGRLQADTGGRPESSLVWRELLAGYDVVDAASVVFKDRYGCWGFLELWRTGDRATFDDKDAAYLTAIAAPVTEILRRFQGQTFHAVRTGQPPDGPVVLVLTAALEVRAQTAQTEAYLRALVPPDGDRRPVPAGALNVGAQLLANEAGVDGHPPRARVHFDQGLWLSLQAARIAGPNGDSDIAVTIQTASSGERIELFARAHALSRREAELLDGLGRGSDTRQLAAALHVSENTVQDHLKSIFAKTGTRTRRALMARALGS